MSNSDMEEGPQGFVTVPNFLRWYCEPRGLAPGTIRNKWIEPGCPQLPIAYKMGVTGLVNVYDALRHAEEMDAWRANDQARAAARKAEEDRKFWARVEAEQERVSKQGEVLRQGLEATQQRMAEVERTKYMGPITPARG
jgi:hypothetical protein